MDAVVKKVYINSIADEIGMEQGDVIVSIDGQPLKDILDFKFLSASDEYELEILKTDGTTEIIEIINEDYEELGVEFENGLLDKPQVCKNKCMFCFVDQLPRNCMRKTLYFKDDDYRLSALMGNYITLTNLDEEDIDRIVRMQLPRINISIHSVNPEIRSKLLNHKNADVMPYVKRFAEAGITMDCQVVCCPGINDGKDLDNTISTLAEYYPQVQSLSVVPVGLTKYREHLPNLTRFDKIKAEELIKQVEGHQLKCLEKFGSHFVYASDEFYVKADFPIPEAEVYESFLQIENGVGLLASLKDEFEQAKSNFKKYNGKKTIATGVSAAPFIRGLVESITDNVEVVAIKNKFLGETITVAGLITAGDLIEQLSDIDLGAELLIPRVMLNHDKIFLDDKTIEDVEKALNIKIVTVENDGYDLVEKIGR
ncbi:MAG: DUF512 domain-containing protein [Clostridia bacterium]|nr:DUF512 domain-containing protein [Clostridia bacterium]